MSMILPYIFSIQFDINDKETDNDIILELKDFFRNCF